MVLLCNLLFTSVITFSLVSGEQEDESSAIYGKLLKSLIKVNEERLDALKKVFKLQQKNVSDMRADDRALTSHQTDLDNDTDDGRDEHPDDSDDVRGENIILIVDDSSGLRTVKSARTPTVQNSADYENADTDSLENVNLNKKQRQMLRKNWRSSCDRKAAKVCMKACNNAYKATCKTYSCSRKMTKSFKSHCKNNCKSKFEDGNDDKSNESD